MSNSQPVQSSSNREVAYHEAGHVIVALSLGLHTGGASLSPQISGSNAKAYLGVRKHDTKKENRREAAALCMALLAGWRTLVKLGAKHPLNGADKDIGSALKTACQSLIAEGPAPPTKRASDLIYGGLTNSCPFGLLKATDTLVRCQPIWEKIGDFAEELLDQTAIEGNAWSTFRSGCKPAVTSEGEKILDLWMETCP